MKGLPILVLLSSAVQLCSAAPALLPVTCSEESGAAAARLALHHINEHHDHGYKFRLSEIQSSKVKKVDGGCNIEQELDLLETKCHTVNPKHFEECEIRGQAEQMVMANCTVMMTVENSAAEVTKYKCDTRQVNTNMEMVKMCPDCPTLIPLNSPEGLKSVNEAVRLFNQNTTNKHYYILQEVGRIRSGFMMMAGMGYFAESVLVETRCPVGSRIIPEACKPLCPDRAHHAFCRSSSSSGNISVECEFYPPSNTTALGPGEQEPVCRRPHPSGHPRFPIPPRPAGPHSIPSGQGPPPHAGGKEHAPHAHGQGPPPHAGGKEHAPHAHGQGPPPHAGSREPPPHAHGQGPPPGQDRLQHRHHQHLHPCHGFLTNFDPALHPICPWPHPQPRPDPKPGPSQV